MNIGSVKLNCDYYNEKYKYSDGIERQLLEIVKNGDINKTLAKSECWPYLYHLHPDRQNVLSWRHFNGREDVLEVGSGCGAITGLLAKKCKSVVCNDISMERSEINAYRNKNFNNIEIYVCNFMDLPKENKFDIITLIGVLEYARIYIGSKNPYADMLKSIYGMLKPGGSLLLAIENQFGLKYWAGCREDHLSQFFIGIEGYNENSPARTFSRNKLRQMLHSAGFSGTNFYYPMPDYKFAYEIFSDDRLPQKGELKNLIHNYDSSRLHAFDESRVYDGLIEEGMFPFFANSFLIEAKK